MQAFWMVLGEGVPVVRHASEQIARAEAVRLAEINKGKVFTVLESKACVKVPKPEPIWSLAVKTPASGETPEMFRHRMTMEKTKGLQSPGMYAHQAHPYVCKCDKCEVERPF